ncbi:hypothetical protein LLG95_16765 [bacterium]|nr:hypothetical protein [bacterium]
MKANFVRSCMIALALLSLHNFACAGWDTTVYGPSFSVNVAGYDGGGVPGDSWWQNSWGESTQTNTLYYCVVIMEGAVEVSDPNEPLEATTEGYASFDRSIHETWSGLEPPTCRTVSDDFECTGTEYICVNVVGGSSDGKADGWGQSACYLSPEDRYLGTIFDMFNLEVTKEMTTTELKAGYYHDSSANPDVVWETNNPYVYTDTTVTSRYGAYNSYKEQYNPDSSDVEGYANYHCAGSYSTYTNSSSYKNDHGYSWASGSVLATAGGSGDFLSLSSVSVAK